MIQKFLIVDGTWAPVSRVYDFRNDIFSEHLVGVNRFII